MDSIPADKLAFHQNHGKDKLTGNVGMSTAY